MRYITSPVKGQPDHRKVFDNKNKRHIKDCHGNMVFTKPEAKAFTAKLNFEQHIAAFVRTLISRDERVLSAARFAHAAHSAENQLRKYTDLPYIIHPLEVARLVSKTKNCTIEMIQAALLHDVVEDTSVTLTDIKEKFGNNVAVLVDWLTDVSKPEDGNRAVRKALDREHIAKAPNEAKRIKLADIIDNTDSIYRYDRKFFEVYSEEKRALLTVLEGAAEDLWLKAAINQLTTMRS